MLFTGCDEIAKEVSTTITGNVSEDGVPVQGAIVIAMEGLTIGGLTSNEINLSNGSFTRVDGNYTIVELDPGTYQILAVKDLNDNNMIDWDSDQIGIYGTEIAGIPTGFTDVTIEADGDDIEDVDITNLYVWPL